MFERSGGRAPRTAPSLQREQSSRFRKALAAAGILIFGAAGITALILLAGGGSATAAPTCTITFTHTAGGDYFTAANWTDTSSAHRVPTTTDYACIPASITGSVTFSTGASSTVGGVSIQGAGGFSMTSGTLTLTSTTSGSTMSAGTLSGGTITGAGALSIGGTTTWNNAIMSGTGTTTIAHGTSLTAGGTSGPFLERPLVNDGTLAVMGGHNGLYFDGGTLTNDSDGLVNLEGDGADLQTYFGTGSVNNTGTLEHSSGTGVTVINTSLTTPLNDLLVQTGTLTLEGGATLSGTATIPTGSTLDFDIGTFTMNSNVTFSGAGTTEMDSGSAIWQLPASTTTTVTTQFPITGGTITGAGALSIGGTTTWNNAIMSGTGTTTIAHGTSLTAGGTSGPFLERPLVNDGTLAVMGGHNGLYFDGGTLTNDSDGLVNLEGDGADLQTYFGTGSVNNMGTLEHSSGTGVTVINTSLTTPLNDLLVQTGTLTLEGGATLSGTATIPTGSTLDFDIGTFTMNSNVTFSGAGTTEMDSGSAIWQLPASTTTTVTTQFPITGGTITGAGALSIGGTTTWNNAIMSGTGTTTIAHGTSLTAGGTSGPFLERPLVNDGTLAVMGGHNGLYFDGGTLTNDSDGLVNLEGDGADLQTYFGTGSVNNMGTLEHSSGTGVTVINTSLTTPLNDLLVQTGTLTLEGGATLSGTATIPTGSTLDFDIGTFTMNSNVTFSGAGTTEMDSGSAIWQLPASTTTTVTTQFPITGGTITGAGALSIGGTTTWNNAIMSGTGTTTIAHGTSLTAGGTSGPFLERPLVNDGTLAVMGGHNGLYFDGGTLTNDSDGLVNLEGDGADLQTYFGTGSVNNMGTLEHSSGTGVTVINTSLTNSSTGTIEVTTGALQVPTLTNLASGILTGGSYNLTGVLELTGLTGSLVTNAASLTLNGVYSLMLNSSSGNALATLATNTGAITLTGGRTLATTASAFGNSGKMIIGDGTTGSTFSSNGPYSQTAGSTVVAKGSTLTPTASTVTIQGGTLTGAGTVSRPVVTTGSGSVQNASAAGPLALAGGYSGTGTVSAAVTSATVFDRIAVTGTANLTSSTLALSTSAAYTPVIGQTFTILTCTTACTGPFASVSGLTLPGGDTYKVGYTATSVTLTVQSPVITSFAITTTSLPSATKGVAYTATLTAVNGNPPYTWKLVKGSGTLPKGLRLTAKTGVISGKPTSSAVTSTFTIEALDTKTKTKPKTQNTTTKTFTITVS